MMIYDDLWNTYGIFMEVFKKENEKINELNGWCSIVMLMEGQAWGRHVEEVKPMYMSKPNVIPCWNGHVASVWILQAANNLQEVM